MKQTRVRGFEFVSGGLVVRVAPRTRVPRCSGCLCRVRRVYDSRPRRWRHLDLAGMAMWLAYNLRRLDCPRCGVLVELVPWAEPWVWFTHEFEEMVAYLAQRTDKTTIVTMLRVAWATVGAIIERVVARLGGRDRLEGLTHIGIDELSYRRHHEYVTVVVDHVRGVVVWVHPGKNAETLNHFFEALGTERAGKLEAVTIDMSKAYIQVVGTASPQARIVFDRFHVQRLTHEALDEVRREQVREIAGTEEAQAIKHTRFALQKNPWNLSELETERLVEVQRTNRPLYRAYLLKETLCAILDRRQVHVARQKLLEWIRWAARSRLLPFQKLARTIRKYAEGILAYVASRLSNGRSEGLNGKIRTITRRAYGFHNVHSLIALIFLCCSNIRLDPVRTYPVLPLNLSESPKNRCEFCLASSRKERVGIGPSDAAHQLEVVPRRQDRHDRALRNTGRSEEPNPMASDRQHPPCSFCGKGPDEAGRLVSSGGAGVLLDLSPDAPWDVVICDVCLALCTDLLAAHGVDDEARPPEPEGSKMDPAAERILRAAHAQLRCSFCGKGMHEVTKLIPGPRVAICDRCVERCNDFITDETFKMNG